MKMVISDGVRVPIKLWLDDTEEGALLQARNAANLPFAYKHIALMPDCHQGYGVPIGTVLATEGVVIPNAVGVDIGCGMCAVKTSLKVEQIDKEILKKVMGEIRKVIPLGKDHHKNKQDQFLMPFSQYEVYTDEFRKLYPIVHQEYESALKQIGTLGSGNHFLEIQKDKDDNIWIMIHSGSRNLGYKVANYYNKVAIELNQRWHSAVPKEWELAFLPLDTDEGQSYISEMQYCVDFALANRKVMMERILQSFADILTESKIYGLLPLEPMINIAHNYASMENHFGKNVMVHRKGATLAREGTIGIIPGSMGSKSYIVEGKGNAESFNSCSHGAGRRVGRKEAVRTLDLESEKKILDDLGIIHGIRHQDDLEEAPSAYKDIDKAMQDQEDLVKILVELQPLAVIKG